MLKKRSVLLVLMLLLSICVFGACGEKETDAVEKSGSEATDSAQAEESSGSYTLFGEFYTQSLYGEDITEEIFAQADLTMVNIWGTFCGPCIQEMPDLGELNREYAEQGFQIVGLISDVNEANDKTAIQIVEETQADYTHMVSSLDMQNNILRYVNAVPTTVFIDKEGNLVGNVYSGAREKEEWALIIEELLSEVQ